MKVYSPNDFQFVSFCSMTIFSSQVPIVLKSHSTLFYKTIILHMISLRQEVDIGNKVLVRSMEFEASLI